jgi:hypothetical protein
MRRQFAVIALIGIGACASITAAAGPPPSTSTTNGYWTLAMNAAWADARLLHEGYLPFSNDGKRILCRLDETPRVGSRLNPRVFCGDAETLSWLYNSRSFVGGQRR